MRLPFLLLSFLFFLLISISFSTAKISTQQNREISSSSSSKYTLPPSISKHLGSLLTLSSSSGFPCISCTIIISLVDQVAVIREVSVDKLLDEICTWFPAPITVPCEDFVTTFGDTIVNLLLKGLNADDVCQTIGFCNASQGCRLWPQKDPEGSALLIAGAKRELASELAALTSKRSVGDTPWDWLMREINVLAQKHEPLVDFDSDLFSEYTETLRGSYWRGKDCDDFRSSVYPGRDSSFESSNPIFDLNCNGIFGSDNSGNSYEQKFCAGTGQRGVVILGDSAAAHFHIPVPYMHAPDINETTYQNFIDILENEFDWPQLSWTTGHLNSTHDNPGPVDSIYLRMRQRNLCNHRDYQNIGVNGAGTGSMSGSIEKSLKRNATDDNPLLIFYALIGNDVCHPEHTLGAMTTPQQFYTNVMNSLTYLEQNVPKGSHVVFMGLVDGRILWDTLHNLTHPIGVTYERIYAYLNCLELNPCWAWLNSNETIRNAGSARAAELNGVYQDIIGKHNNSTFKNFDMVYFPFPLPQVIAKWVAAGGHVQDLIEPIDGFHPSQLGNFLFADEVWGMLEKSYPSYLGPVNPNNAAIASIFGNQGGY